MVPHGVRVAQVSPGPVVSALLAVGRRKTCARPRESGSLVAPEEVADAVVYMLTRKRTVTIRDMIVLPSNFDRV